MFTIREIKKALRIKGYTEYEVNHTINLIKEMKTENENSASCQTDVSSRVVTPIKIKVKLRQTQFLGFNQWKCNIHGEERIVTMQWVEWYCMSIEDAINSFKQYQVEEFTISGQFS